MGLSSNARLLSLTARITSNEYESQKIANAKMRLATQSQQASKDYIDALNTNKLMFMTYDSYGSPVTTDLTAALFYQYGDSKSQYALSNSMGQLLIKAEDKANFEGAKNLEEFLAANGVEKIWKNEKLAQLKEEMNNYAIYKQDWEQVLNEYKNKTYQGTFTNINESGNYYTENYSFYGAEDAWECEKVGKWNDYIKANDEYNNKLSNYLSQETTVTVSGEVRYNSAYISDEEIADAYDKQNNLYSEYTPYVTFDSWIEMKAKEGESGKYDNYQKYLEKVTAFNAETEKFESLNEAYSYSDSSKAQWYTNLWYRLNGESSEKNKFASNNYALLEDNLLNSASWLQDAFAQGSVILESASYIKTADQIPDLNSPNIVNLKGITWNSKVYSACPDITTDTDNAAIAKAEAEYEQKTKDITAKEKKFDSQMKTLETEHEALTKEYESVESALNANISRSYKTFNT